MPSEQCPECGRFLSRAFVRGARQSPAPCPGCDALVDMALAAPPSRVAAANDRGAATVSIVPPADAPADSPPAAPPASTPVADAPVPTTSTVTGPSAARHPLDDWDRGSAPARTARQTTVVAVPVLVAAGGGAVLGALLAGRDHRALGVILGAATAAVVARRLD